MTAFLKGLCIFVTDLRADRHLDWYCIRSVSLVITRRDGKLLIYQNNNELCNAFRLYYQ